MTIEEERAMLAELRRKILDAVKRFEEETGLTLERVETSATPFVKFDGRACSTATVRAVTVKAKL